jgi:Cu/Ag efflux pump CusA
MHFIFGYQREIPVKIKTEASVTALVGLAILIILLLIFLSFENLDGEILTHPNIPASQSTFDDLAFLEMSNQVNSLGEWLETFWDFSGLVR